MQRAQGLFGVFLGDQHADLDLGRRDDLDVYAFFGQGLEHALGDAGMRAHADADDRNLDHVGIGNQVLVLKFLFLRLDGFDGALQITLGDGERQVRRLAVGGDVLDDHIDVDAGVRQRPEDGRRDAR